MRPRRVYPKAFNGLWDSFDEIYGKKGSKENAYREYRKFKITDCEALEFIEIVKNQQAEKATLRIHGKFCESFCHVERWLRNRRFEDDTSQFVYEESLPRSDQKKFNALERYFASDVGRGVESATSSEDDLRGTGQHDVRVLEDKS